MVASVSVDIELKVPAEKLWKVIVKESRTFLPKILPPEAQVSVEYVQGHIVEAGTVRLIKSTRGEGSYIKQTFEEVDEHSYSTTIKVIEAKGEDSQKYVGYKYKIKFTPGPDESITAVSWIVESEAGFVEESPEENKKDTIQFLKQAETYILSHEA